MSFQSTLGIFDVETQARHVGLLCNVHAEAKLKELPIEAPALALRFAGTVWRRMAFRFQPLVDLGL